MNQTEYEAICDFFDNAPYELTEGTFPSIINRHSTQSEHASHPSFQYSASVSSKSSGKGI